MLGEEGIMVKDLAVRKGRCGNGRQCTDVSGRGHPADACNVLRLSKDFHDTDSSFSFKLLHRVPAFRCLPEGPQQGREISICEGVEVYHHMVNNSGA